jgi:hypothetical protein
MNTYLFLLAERVAGQQEMQRFAHPIHHGIINATDFADAYEQVLENLRPTFADRHPPLEIRFEQMSPPHDAAKGSETSMEPTPGPRAGIWRHHKPIDMDITFTSDD